MRQKVVKKIDKLSFYKEDVMFCSKLRRLINYSDSSGSQDVFLQ